MNVEALEKLDSTALTGLADKIQWLMDRAEIEDVLSRYSRGIDRADVEVLKSVYHEGATDEHGLFSGTGSGFSEWTCENIKSTYITIHHNFTTRSMDIRGNEAQVEQYFLCVNRSVDTLVFCGGRCADRFEKRGGRWGIVHRQVIMDWTEKSEKFAPWELESQFVQGKYEGEDVTYQQLRRLRNGGFYPGRPRD